MRNRRFLSIGCGKGWRVEMICVMIIEVRIGRDLFVSDTFSFPPFISITEERIYLFVWYTLCQDLYLNSHRLSYQRENVKR